MELNTVSSRETELNTVAANDADTAPGFLAPVKPKQEEWVLRQGKKAKPATSVESLFPPASHHMT